ncbi:hypothetical protein C2845_PM02G07930 [Panicum miliaceum]|uniref:Uncharacterized protein n=1 Tax=Panicum miliaceum TaxID=4540 RepID=A0A3L6S6C6_PANMI|nr:hypothetical protein C2845_PM02G07930 [Panicum miliaceum]
MAASAVEKLKALWDSQVNDEEQWALNYVLRAKSCGSNPLALVAVGRPRCRVVRGGTGGDDLPLRRFDSTARLPL